MNEKQKKEQEMNDTSVNNYKIHKNQKNSSSVVIKNIEIIIGEEEKK